ncbi:MAG TPA: hypothetical protein VJI15_04565 [Candidatus Nanoarchaeia archaeon]|nr:hypothetical protein [Candidatus Nanoarchaeia archaeon]
MTSADTRFDHSKVSQLEAEIARHEAFLKLPEVFTYVGMLPDIPNYENRKHIRELLPYLGRTGGYFSLGTHPDPDSDSTNQHYDFLPVHFVDNTSGRIMEYLRRRDIMTTRRRLFSASMQAEEHQLVLKGEPHEKTEGWGSSDEYRPRIIVFPHDGHFYMENTKDPLEDIRQFKERIRGNAEKKIKSAQQYIKDHQDSIIKAQEQREQEEKRRSDLIGKKGIKI